MKTLGFLAAAAAAMLVVPAASAAPMAGAPAPVTASAIASSSPTAALHLAVSGDSAQRWRDRRHHRRASWRRVCNNRWRNGHRVRVCRRVRGWR